MKHSMMGLMLLLTTASVWAGTFFDNFDDGNMDEWTLRKALGQDAKSTWKIENGELVFEAIDSAIDFKFENGTGRINEGIDSAISFTIGEPTWNNYTVRVKAKIVRHQPNINGLEGAQLMVRVNATGNNLYIFTVGTGAAGLAFSLKLALVSDVVQNVQHIQYVFADRFDWQRGTWYDLRVTVEGDLLKFYINDVLFVEYTPVGHSDTRYSTGSVGVGVCCEKTTVHFDDFSVTYDDVPDTLTAVDSKAKLATTWAIIKQRR